MIKCGKLKGENDKEAEQCILFSEKGKPMGYFLYSEHGGEEGAREAATKHSGQVQFFKQKHQGLLDAIDAFGAPVVLKYLLDKAADCEACQEVLKSYVERSSVEKAEKKRPSSEEVWEKEYGGSHKACVKVVAGRGVQTPEAYCAWLKDKLLHTTEWRGKGKKPCKSLTEIAEEALLQKDNQDNIDLSELEAWLAGDAGGSGSDASPPASDAKPEPVAEPALSEGEGPEPAPMEELPNDFRTFLLRDHAQRRAGVLAHKGEEVTDNG